MAIDTSLPQMQDTQPFGRAIVPQSADGQSTDRWLQLPLLFLKAGLAGGLLRRPSSAGSTATGTGAPASPFAPDD
jgi:hypothetical protein